MDTKVCVRCGVRFAKPRGVRGGAWGRRRYCSAACHISRELLPTFDRFYNHVGRPTPAGCWEWTGVLGGRGYGKFRFDDKMQPAHRVSWQITFGEIPDGLLVCHHCDNRLCVRPEHLFLGTASDNALDAYRKGRLNPGLYDGSLSALGTRAQVKSRSAS